MGKQVEADSFQDPAVLSQRVRRRMHDLVKNKYGDDDILKESGQMGMASEQASVLLDHVKVQRVADKRKAAMRGAMIGGVWLAISGAILIAMFVTGGPAFQLRIIWTAAAFGVYLIGSNLLAWRNAKP